MSPSIRHCWCFLRWVSSTRRSATLEPIYRPHVRHWYITSHIVSHRRKSPTLLFLPYNTPQHFLTLHCGLAVLGIVPSPTLRKPYISPTPTPPSKLAWLASYWSHPTVLPLYDTTHTLRYFASTTTSAFSYPPIQYFSCLYYHLRSSPLNHFVQVIYITYHTNH